MAMRFVKLIITILLLAFVSIAAYFGWRYFFDPAGINIADSEICTTNESGQTLVFSVETKPGAKVIGLLEHGERLCAPSPVKKPAGIVRVGPAEDKLECIYELDGPNQLPFVTAYHGPGNCDWGFVSR